MASITYKKAGDSVILAVRGELDGSAAWRVSRLALRLTRSHRVQLDLDGVTRLLGFGASVLARNLATLPVVVTAIRPEHRRILAAEGVVAGDVERAAS